MGIQFDSIVFGGICCDIIFSGMAGLPAEGQEVFAESFKITVGGVFNVAAAAARLNMKTGLPCMLGTDFLSGFIRQTAREEAVDSSFFCDVNQPYEQVSVVMNMGRERAFLSYNAESLEEQFHRHLEEVAAENRAAVGGFSMSDHPLYPQLMRKMAENGSRIMLDCSWDEAVLRSEALRRQITCCHYFTPNLSEALLITGEKDAAEAALALSELCENVIVKVGGDGAVWARGGRITRFPAPEYGPVVDTTGAGDNFSAGFSYGLTHGYQVEQCIGLGLICGSKSTLAIGGFAAAPYESELLFLEKQTKL